MPQRFHTSSGYLEGFCFLLFGFGNWKKNPHSVMNYCEVWDYSYNSVKGSDTLEVFHLFDLVPLFLDTQNDSTISVPVGCCHTWTQTPFPVPFHSVYIQAQLCSTGCHQSTWFPWCLLHVPHPKHKQINFPVLVQRLLAIWHLYVLLMFLACSFSSMTHWPFWLGFPKKRTLESLAFNLLPRSTNLSLL